MLARIAAAVPLPGLLLAGAAAVAAAAEPAGSSVTVYRCLDGQGRLVALRDTPCRDGERQEAVRMQRPQDPPPRPVPAAPAAPPAASAPVQEVRVVTLQPPQPMYECTTPEGDTYTSDSGDGNPRWVPLWTLGVPLGAMARPPLVRPPVPGPPPARPPGTRPPGPGPGPRPPPPALFVPGGTWMRDACVRLPQADICRRLSDRRFEILRIYHAAMPSGRAELDREQARIDARMANDCR